MATVAMQVLGLVGGVGAPNSTFPHVWTLSYWPNFGRIMESGQTACMPGNSSLAGGP